MTAAPAWPPCELEPVSCCPFCDSEERSTAYEGLQDRFFGVAGQWMLRRCKGCGGGYLDPRPRADLLGRLYAEYYTHTEPEEPPQGGTPVRRIRRSVRNGYLNVALGYQLAPASPFARLLVAPFSARRRKARLLVRDLPYRAEAARLLDVGTGNGSFLVRMTWAGWEAAGVEPDPRAVATARRRGLTVHEGTIDDVDALPHSYHAITMNHVFEHLPRPVESLQRCRELLCPDGLLWIAAPNFDAPGHHRFGRDWIGLDAPRHLVLPSAQSLRRALSTAGFDVEFLRPNAGAWFWHESQELRAGRLRARWPRWRDRLRNGVGARVQDIRARHDPSAGEELVVLARPTR